MLYVCRGYTNNPPPTSTTTTTTRPPFQFDFIDDGSNFDILTMQAQSVNFQSGGGTNLPKNCDKIKPMLKQNKNRYMYAFFTQSHVIREIWVGVNTEDSYFVLYFPFQ